MFRILNDIIFPPSTPPAPATPPPADPVPASSCASAVLPTGPSLGLILGVVGAVVVLAVLLIVLQARRAKAR